jgi:anti-sigma factor RsiW
MPAGLSSGDLPPHLDNGAGPCGGFAVKTLLYLDNDLRGRELEEFRAHLDSCVNCREHMRAEQALSRLLHRARPLYEAPAALLARVSAECIEQSAIPAARAPDRRALQFLGAQVPTTSRLLSLRVLAPALLIAAIFFVLVPETVRQVQAANYAQTAVEEHRSYLNGQLPLELRSTSSEVVTAWFADKVPFDFHLPAAESLPENKPTYKLTGAARVSYKGVPAALVTYEGAAGKISLLIASAKSVVVVGGDVVQSGKLTFHYRTDDGYRVITWSNHSLAYALVSSVSGTATESCLVCHQNMTDRDAYRDHP